MNPKLVLAESLETLRKAEAKELESDKLQELIAKGSRPKSELLRLKKSFSDSYDMYIRGLEFMNYVRRTAIGASQNDLSKFCEERMVHYMDRCESLRAKEANILLPLSQMEHLVKDGYTVKAAVVQLKGSESLSKDCPWYSEAKLSDGSYLVVAKNLDNYSVAAPSVTVEIVVKSSRKNHSFVLKKTIPCQCGWTRTIGVVDEAQLQVRVTCDAVFRECHVSLQVLRLEEQAEGCDWMKTLPRIDDIEPLPVLPAPPVAPKERVTVCVNPKNVILSKRLEVLRLALDSWPVKGVSAVSIPKSDQFLLQAVHNLPIPTDVCGDGDAFNDVNFHVSGSELEAH